LQLGKFFFSDFSLRYFELIFVLVLSLGGLLKVAKITLKFLLREENIRDGGKTVHVVCPEACCRKEYGEAE
jgi:hypothetical protein